MLRTIPALFVASAVLVAGRSVLADEGGAPASVDMFAAMAAGDLDVKLIPKDSKEANVLIKNKTDKPLRVKLPEAFAGVPVLAQIGGVGGGVGGGGAQGVGGGLGGGGAGGAGGFFNIAPQKVAKVKAPTVCLEHGKNEPNPRLEYEITPLGEFNDDPAVYEVCKALGHHQIDQRSAQAAAWHLANDMTWSELAQKIGAKHLNGTVTPFFTRAEILRGMQIARVAAMRAEEAAAVASPGEQATQ